MYIYLTNFACGPCGWRCSLRRQHGYLDCRYWPRCKSPLRSGAASVTILAIFWPLLSESCVTILSWHVVTATETICGIVRGAAALRPGYRRPATSHSGAAEAARWWPAGTSCCPLTEDKCQNRSWCREHTSTFYCMWPIFYDTGTIYILPVFTVSRECLWACQRNQKCYEFQNSEIVLVTPRRKQFNGL